MGRISEGPTTSLIDRTLEFVSSELAAWRDDPERTHEEAEERLNAQLCKYLAVAASDRFPMVFFHHEEKQTGKRRVDISALPKSGMFVGQTYLSKYDAFLVFEGKRLPAPSASREREYVTGGIKRSGGIQRFKLALHGAQQTTAAMIGYVQSEAFALWLSRINGWIMEEVSNQVVPGENWSLSECLSNFEEDPDLRVAGLTSVHARSAPAVSAEIRLRHFWVAISD
jgi:hypothetical protein